MPAYNLRYHLGVDGISLFLVLLTTLLMPIVIYFSNLFVKESLGPYLALMLVLQAAMTGLRTDKAFSARKVMISAATFLSSNSMSTFSEFALDWVASTIA